MLKNKKIVLAICGSIAAYKSAVLVRLLVKAGAEVKVLMTNEATHFITPLTLSVLSRNKVLFGLVTGDEQWNNHVELGLWGDIMLVAPASANTIAKMSAGFCDNIVLATYLSARCPVWLAPAMDEDMWQHASTRDNISKLAARGNNILPVEKGELASGLIGPGRMAEPEEILSHLEDFFASDKEVKKKLKGVKAVVSAGPTREAIDPVRYISNHSSGKMGIAMAEELASAGADVILILGPVSLRPENNNIKIIPFISASELEDAMMKYSTNADVIIMTAAVADYTPVTVAENKIKKKEGVWELELKKTGDILQKLGEKKNKKQLLVGFALETNNEKENALEKLRKKNLDYIVLNSMKDAGAGFAYDTNKVTILSNKGESYPLPLQSKKDTAKAIVQYIFNEK